MYKTITALGSAAHFGVQPGAVLAVMCQIYDLKEIEYITSVLIMLVVKHMANMS